MTHRILTAALTLLVSVGALTATEPPRLTSAADTAAYALGVANGCLLYTSRKTMEELVTFI